MTGSVAKRVVHAVAAATEWERDYAAGRALDLSGPVSPDWPVRLLRAAADEAPCCSCPSPLGHAEYVLTVGRLRVPLCSSHAQEARAFPGGR